jgi:hypothetical protein
VTIRDGGLIAGHARVLAARQLGIAEIPVMVAAGWSAGHGLSLSRRARAPSARSRRKSRAVGDRSADPVCQKCADPHGCAGRRDSREHQGMGLDDAGAGGRGSEAQKRAYVLADNQLAITGSGWDPELRARARRRRAAPTSVATVLSPQRETVPPEQPQIAHLRHRMLRSRRRVVRVRQAPVAVGEAAAGTRRVEARRV